jgi:hypothetical protein
MNADGAGRVEQLKPMTRAAKPKLHVLSSIVDESFTEATDLFVGSRGDRAVHRHHPVSLDRHPVGHFILRVEMARVLISIKIPGANPLFRENDLSGNKSRAGAVGCNVRGNKIDGYAEVIVEENQ